MKAPLFAVLVLACAGAVRADDGAAAGRSILAKYQEAVVTVRLVVSYSMTMGGHSHQNETKTEALGTVLDPSGLTVISLATIDPSAMMKARQRGGAEEIKVDAAVKDAKIVFADGSEAAAAVVLRDKDLDVAFLRPIEKLPKPAVAVDLRGGAKPQVLDEVVCLNRLGKIADRAVAVSLERIDAMVLKPQPYYVIAAGGSSGIGSPVFALSGAPVGVILIRNGQSDGDANAASMFSGTATMGMMPIVAPASDVLEDAKQALAAKLPAKPEPE
jgi:hypothetical protein